MFTDTRKILTLFYLHNLAIGLWIFKGYAIIFRQMIQVRIAKSLDSAPIRLSKVDSNAKLITPVVIATSQTFQFSLFYSYLPLVYHALYPALQG